MHRTPHQFPVWCTPCERGGVRAVPLCSCVAHLSRRSTWSAVISLTSRAGELRSAPSGPEMPALFCIYCRALGGNRHLSALLCFSLVCVLATCADLLSPPALLWLCHVAVCVWVSMFAIWILDFHCTLFIYLFASARTCIIDLFSLFERERPHRPNK